MKYIRPNLTGFALIFCTNLLIAQSTGEVNSSYSGDTSYNYSTVRQKKYEPDKKFPYKSFIIPAVLISYGFIDFYFDPVTDINEGIKKEVWTERPHAMQHIDTYLQFAPAAAVYALNGAGIKGKNNFFDRSMIYLMSNVIMNGTVFSLKQITHKQRPDGSDYSSFPSGHTAEAFVSAEFLYQEYKDVSVWYGISGYAVAAVVGGLRIYNNKHWFNDVVAGAGFGIASTKLSYWLYPKIKNKFSKNKPMHSMILPGYDGRTVGLSWVHIF